MMSDIETSILSHQEEIRARRAKLNALVREHDEIAFKVKKMEAELKTMMDYAELVNGRIAAE